MDLKEQVCNLKLSKKLKELGVIQESLFHWVNHDTVYSSMSAHNEGWDVETSFFVAGIGFDYSGMLSNKQKHKEFTQEQIDEFEHYSAFTVAELGKLLPREVEHTKNEHSSYYIMFGYGDNMIDGSVPVVWYEDNDLNLNDEILQLCNGNTEADARAQMLIYLIEGKYI